MNMQLEPLQSRWLNMLNIDVWVSVRAPFCQWGVPSHLLSPGYLELAPPSDCGSPTCVGVMSFFFGGGRVDGENHHRPNRHEQQKRNMFEYVEDHHCTYTKLSYKSAQDAKTLPFIYAQIMATHSCLHNGCSFGFSVFPRQKRRQQSLKALPSPWNGAASSGA